MVRFEAGNIVGRVEGTEIGYYADIGGSFFSLGTPGSMCVPLPRFLSKFGKFSSFVTLRLFPSPISPFGDRPVRDGGPHFPSRPTKFFLGKNGIRCNGEANPCNIPVRGSSKQAKHCLTCLKPCLLTGRSDFVSSWKNPRDGQSPFGFSVSPFSFPKIVFEKFNKSVDVSSPPSSSARKIENYRDAHETVTSGVRKNTETYVGEQKFK
ncbi:hypothetical protein M569_17707 [Genlisea aurea]|uniref:Uncharacterized protein n=1 Tax=Genlisea aurea TaxID=192259 RepID=S8DCM9_9LAMI|nr:hypothetical protein M569_17707 [Genlisea aurea]